MVQAGKSKVPLFSGMTGRYNSFPGAVATWKTPGKKTSEVERHKVYGDWLRGNRTGGLDQAKLATAENNHADKPKTSSFQDGHEVTKRSPFQDGREDKTKTSSFQCDQEMTKKFPVKADHEHKTKTYPFQNGHEVKTKTSSLQDDHEVKTKTCPFQYEHQTKTSPFQRVPRPPDQGSQRDQRCTSAVPGRRKRGDQGLNPRLQIARPLTSKANRMGTRLEPQGAADRFDPVPELDHTVAPKPKQDSVENGPEVTEMETPPEKDSSCGNIVPGVSCESEESRTTSSVPNPTEQDEPDVRNVSEGQTSAKEQVRPRTARGPKVRFGRGVMDITNSESTSQAVQFDGETTGSNSYLEERKHSPAECKTGEVESEERDEHRPSTEDGQEKTPDVMRSLTTEPDKSSSSNNNNNNNNNTADDVNDLLP